MLEGAFSFVLVDATHLVGVRDPAGLRPLCLGPARPRRGTRGLGARVRDARPRHRRRHLRARARARRDGRGRLQGRAVRAAVPRPSAVDPHLCIFEFVYFARPDSRLYGREVHSARRRMGELLAAQAPVDADLVMGVPESGVPAAEGYARASGIPHGQGLVKNRYIGRTFITPGPGRPRRRGAPQAQPAAREHRRQADRRRRRLHRAGTTQRAVVRMLREAGALEVHLRISSPPLAWPCFYGIDIPDRDQLLAASTPCPRSPSS